MKAYHTFGPVYSPQSRILILCSFPSVKSREQGFYYGHPQNRFWRVLADVFQQALPVSKEEKVAFCLRNHIALWDVLRSCAIEGADDGSIREPVANDLSSLLQETHIHTICTTGTKAAALYKRLCLPSTRLPSVSLPSTSPANCRHYTYARLVEAYSILPGLCSATKDCINPLPGLRRKGVHSFCYKNFRNFA